MSEDNLFSEFDEEETTEETPKPEPTPSKESSETSIKPSEVFKAQDNPYEGLTDDQKIILGDIANFYGINVNEVIIEFNRAYLDKHLNRFNNNLPKKFDLAYAIMKSVLDEKAKIKSFSVRPIGKNVFYSPKANMVISTVVALMSYEDKDTPGRIIKKRKSIKSFDYEGDIKYKSLHKMINFYDYEPMLKRNDKDEFQLSEYSSFEIGTPPDGKMANMSDLEIYRGLKIIPKESVLEAGMSRIPKGDEWPDPCDLKAVFVLGEPFRTFKPPKDFPDVSSISSNAIDFKGNKVTLGFPALPEFEALVAEVPKGERFSGVAVGTLREKVETNEVIMNVFNFFLSDEGDQ